MIRSVFMLALASAALFACERNDATGTTQTTSADAGIKEDLQKAGEGLGSAAQKAGHELKEEAKKLDVHVETGVHTGAPCLGCDKDGGAKR